MNQPLADTRIIGTLGRRFAVEAAMHEVDLRDGSIHALHFVRDASDPWERSRYLRALTFQHGETAIFDLRNLAKTLGVDLPGYTERDRAGLIKYTLRPLYGTRAELLDAIRAKVLAVGKFDQPLEAEQQARRA